MRISELFRQKKAVYSFEIFPPKVNDDISKIYSTLDEIRDISPDYVSVTYSAGGSKNSRTAEIADLLKNKYGTEPLAHLTCINSDKAEVAAAIERLNAIGVENIKRVPLMSKEELEESIQFELGNKSLLVTYHPVTLENHTAESQCRNLLDALDEFPDYKVIFTLPNSDTDGRVIIRLIAEYVSLHPKRCMMTPSLGLRRYLSALQYVSAVVGNSSSGIIEVPSFGIPTLDIGDRQKGRIAAESVWHCGVSRQDIVEGLQKLLSPSWMVAAKSTQNPYDKKGTIASIHATIRSYPLQNLQRKSFYNICQR